jgi:uncharacterized membrane protein YfcA
MIGVGGAVFFPPYFIVVMRLDPVLAFTAGLFIEMTTFASGAVGYGREHLIDYVLSKRILAYTVPSCLIGVTIAGVVDDTLIVILLLFLLMFHAHGFLTKRIEPRPKVPRFTQTSFESRHYILGRSIKITSVLGGLLLGSISSGLGEINEYNFLENLRMKPGQASGTSIFILMMTGLASVVGRMFLFIGINIGDLSKISPMVAICLPSAVLGAQIGVKVSERSSKGRFVHLVGILFIVIAAITFIEVFLVH